MTQLTPLQNKVLIKRIKMEDKTKGGLIIPETAMEKPVEGEVVSIGKGKLLENGTLRPLDVKKGDKILFGKYSGTEITLDGKEYLILNDDDIFGVIQ